VLIAQSLLAVAVETVVPQVRDPEYGYRLVRIREQVRAYPNRPLVVVLGTSRTQNAINPSAMDFANEPGSPLVFNFGQSGSRPIHLRLTLQRLHDEGVRPAAVLVEVLPATLIVPGPAESLFMESAPRLTAGDFQRLEPYSENLNPLRRAWITSRLNLWHSQRLVLISHVAPGWLPWPQRLDHQWTMTDNSGYGPFPEVKVDEYRPSRQARVRAAYASVLRHLEVSELSLRAFCDLVSECRSHGIPIAFFLLPESPLFRSWYAPQSHAAVAAFCRMLTNELGCPVFAAPSDYAEEDFADGHHMLPQTATRFSRQLAEQHLAPWLMSEGVTGR